jgi:hypothetical protein
MEEVANISISHMRDLLTFENFPFKKYNILLEGYKKRYEEKIDLFFQGVADSWPVLYEQLAQRIDKRPYLFHYPYLLKPQIANLIQYAKKDKLDVACRLLIQVTDAEIAKREKRFDTALYPSLWTANGDYYISFNEEQKSFVDYDAFKLSNGLTLDFFSPFCLSIPDSNQDLDRVVDIYSLDEASDIFEKLEESLTPIATVGEASGLRAYVSGLLDVIMLKKQRASHGKERTFLCGSNYNYMGKLIMVNPEFAKQEEIIESLVHESTHFLLDIIDEFSKWIPEDFESKFIYSKWTAKKLTYRTYLHAIFVWFSIFKLWDFASSNKIYDPGFVRDRLLFIRRGFKEVSSNEILDVNSKVSPELLSSIDELRDIVLN